MLLVQHELNERIVQLEEILKTNQSTLGNTLNAKQNFEDENKNLTNFIKILETRIVQNEEKIKELKV